jgi:hypothetical protein
MKTKSIKELFENYEHRAMTNLDHILAEVQQVFVDYYADRSPSLTVVANRLSVHRTTLIERAKAQRRPLILPTKFKKKDK